jgi:uncharacterized protein YcbX
MTSPATLQRFEEDLRRQIDVRRFRGNFSIDGGLPWEELNWVDREIEIGNARMRVVKLIERCAATTVNPATGQRDLTIPTDLARLYGHVMFGVYAEVVAGGRIEVGDPVKPSRAIRTNDPRPDTSPTQGDHRSCASTATTSP